MAKTPERKARGPVDSPNNPFGFLANLEPFRPRGGESLRSPAQNTTARAKHAETAPGSNSLYEPRSDLSCLGKPTLLFASGRAPLQDRRSKQESHPNGRNYASDRPSLPANRLPSARTEHHGAAFSSCEVGLRKQSKRALSQSGSRGAASAPPAAKRSRVPEDAPSRHNAHGGVVSASEAANRGASVGSRTSAAWAASLSGKQEVLNGPPNDNKKQSYPVRGALPGDFTFAAEIENDIRRCFGSSTAPDSLRRILHPDCCWLDILGRDSFSAGNMDFVLGGVEDPLAAGYIAGAVHQSLRMHCARLTLGRELTAEESEGLCQAVNRGAWFYAMKKIVPTAASAELNRHYQSVCTGIVDAFSALGKWEMDEAGPTTKGKARAEQADEETQTQTDADADVNLRGSNVVKTASATRRSQGSPTAATSIATVDAEENVDDSEPISLAGLSDDEEVREGDTLEAERFVGTERSSAPPAPRLASASQLALESARLSGPIADAPGRTGAENVDEGNIEAADAERDENCGDNEEDGGNGEPYGGGDENYGEMDEDVEATHENGKEDEGGTDEANENYHDPGDDGDGGGVDENEEEMADGASDGGANDPFVDGETVGSEGSADATVGVVLAAGHEFSGGLPELADQEDKENLAQEPPGASFDVADPPQASEDDLYLEPSVVALEEDDEAAEQEKDSEMDSEANPPGEEERGDGEIPLPEFEIYEDEDGHGEEDSGPPDGAAGSTPRLAGRKVLHPIEEADLRVRDAMRNGPRLDLSPSNPFVTPGTRQRFLTMMRR